LVAYCAVTLSWANLALPELEQQAFFAGVEAYKQVIACH